jgi:hypothetical protein
MKEIITKLGEIILVSDEDFERLSKYKWYLNDSGYAITFSWDSKRKKSVHFRLHRILLGLTDPKIQVDHINGNRIDNRRENLRIVTNAINSRNKTVPSKSNTGYYGVSFKKKQNKYRTYIFYNYKQIYLGTYDTAEEGALAYNKKAEELGYLTRNVIKDSE